SVFLHPPPRPPSSTLFPYTTLFRSELTNVTFTVTGVDSSIPAPSLTISASQLPTGATFSATQGTSPRGTFTWTPSEAQTGTFTRSEEHTSELQSRGHLVCRLLLEKK